MKRAGAQKVLPCIKGGGGHAKSFGHVIFSFSSVPHSCDLGSDIICQSDGNQCLTSVHFPTLQVHFHIFCISFKNKQLVNFYLR